MIWISDQYITSALTAAPLKQFWMLNHSTWIGHVTWNGSGLGFCHDLGKIPSTVAYLCCLSAALAVGTRPPSVPARVKHNQWHIFLRSNWIYDVIFILFGLNRSPLPTHPLVSATVSVPHFQQGRQQQPSNNHLHRRRGQLGSAYLCWPRRKVSLLTTALMGLQTTFALVFF